MNNEIKEILEIFKKINEEYSVDTELNFEDYEIPNIYLKQFLDYITNLQEEIEYEQHCNEQLRNKITNLEYKIERLEEENTKLKDLCDKYEEEHNTTFIEWQKDIKANKKAIEYINSTGYGTDFSMSAEEVDKVLNILQGEQNE